MKSVFLLLGGLAFATAGLILFTSKRAKPVAALAHDLEVAWADHHTVV